MILLSAAWRWCATRSMGLALIAVTLTTWSSLATESFAKDKRIVILTNGDDPFWDACEAGAKGAAKELKLNAEGLAVTFERADFTVKGQVDKLQQYSLQSDIVGLGISVYDPESSAIADGMQALQKKGIKVVTIDGDTSRENFRDARFAYLGTDNLVGGKELGRAAKALKAESKFAFFVGNAGAANAIARMNGFKAGLGKQAKMVESLEDGGDRPKCRKFVQDALDRHPEIDMLVGIWAYNAPQAAEVVKDRKIRGKTKVVCFDAAEAAIEQMKSGLIDVMVVQNPYQMGFDGVRLLRALVKEDKAFIKNMFPEHALQGDKDCFKTELRVVIPDQGSPITKELFEPGTVFMKLSEFQKWLDERKLTSS